MQVTLYGAAGDVTGSAYCVRTSQATVLVDFGVFQGGGAAESRNRVPRGLDPRRVDAVVLTHAHLDHTGRLPLLARRGFDRPIHATPATIELVRLLLRDAARLQEADAERINRKRRRAGQTPVKPLFSVDDAERALRLLAPMPYDAAFSPAEGIEARAVEAGHMLGSVSLDMTVRDGARSARVVFSGDIGPRGLPILRDPVAPEGGDVIFMESTYGDRDHRPLQPTIDEFAVIVRRAVERRAKILVPAFAIGRTQQMLYHLAEMFRDGVVEPFPVWVDSPMAAAANQIYLHHPELFDREASDLHARHQLSRDLATLRTAETADESRALNDAGGPCLIMAGAGMCTGGRILHHLRHNLWQRETAVLFVGYQAPGTLGRRLIDGQKMVSIHGERIAVEATIHSLGGFSAHAGQSDLLRWLAPQAEARPRVVLTHGESRGRAPLARLIREKHGLEPLLPSLGDVIPLIEQR